MFVALFQATSFVGHVIPGRYYRDTCLLIAGWWPVAASWVGMQG